MKSKNKIMKKFLDILVLLAVVSKAWDEIRDKIGDIIEEQMNDTYNDMQIDAMIGLCELLDLILDTIRNFPNIPDFQIFLD